jgi:hypothetical protein
MPRITAGNKAAKPPSPAAESTACASMEWTGCGAGEGVRSRPPSGWRGHERGCERALAGAKNGDGDVVVHRARSRDRAVFFACSGGATLMM